MQDAGPCADMVVMGRRRYNVKHLSQILRALATLDYDNDMVFDRMSQHIMDKMPKADAKTLLDLVGLQARPVWGLLAQVQPAIRSVFLHLQAVCSHS